ncbi:hypothetical protein T484DRAFT_1781743, partial [Baffinella frigidus]
EARGLKQQQQDAEQRARLAEEELGDEQAARARIDEERKKARRDLGIQREMLHAEFEEERAAQDKILTELRETVRKLRGAGAREEELEEVERKAELRLVAAAAEADARLLQSGGEAAAREAALTSELQASTAREAALTSELQVNSNHARVLEGVAKS